MVEVGDGTWEGVMKVGGSSDVGLGLGFDGLELGLI